MSGQPEDNRSFIYLKSKKEWKADGKVVWTS